MGPVTRPSARDRSTTADAPPSPVSSLLRAPAVGSYACAVETCSAVVPMPGVCDVCARRADEAEHHRATAFARSTIPERFRWADLESPDMDARVDRAALAQVRALLGAPLPLGVALIGPAGSGKTTLACAMLRRAHSRAVYGCSAEVMRRARGAFYVSAPELADEIDLVRRERGESELLRMARNATILVLDEASKGGDVSWSIVQRRHERQLPTIITTWEGEAEIARRFGGGFARRALMRVIECHRARK